MNHFKNGIAVAALAVVALLAGCNSSSSSATAAQVSQALKSNPALHAKLTSVEQQGVSQLEKCLPNGKAMVGAVMSGHATVETAFQVVQAFQGTNLAGTAKACVPGGGAHPIRKFDTCLKANGPSNVKSAIAAAVRPYLAHPIKDRHIEYAVTSVATSQATVKTVAVCFHGLTK